MKRLSCRCGQQVYFNNHRCERCGRLLAFDPNPLTMVSEETPGSGLPVCKNRGTAIRCNWIAPDGGACLSCRTSHVIPSLAKVVNRERWRKLERAKRRVLYDLRMLGLPLDPGRLRFVFKEDRRTNPDVDEEHVAIGHLDGVITINAAEADDVYRADMRERMNEPYRTLLGHFRHESGHYYFEHVVDEALRGEARRLFGDERSDYAGAIERYHDQGPPLTWNERYISAYASAHPAEDWAECWAHYLHICAALEAADTMGLRRRDPERGWQREFIELAGALNEVVSSLGLPDPYPFLITPAVAEKLEFVHRAVGRFTRRPGVP